MTMQTQQTGDDDLISAKSPKAEIPVISDYEKILIVYLSRTNNTKAVAKMIQARAGGDLVALELQDPYPENYQEIVARVADENDLSGKTVIPFNTNAGYGLGSSIRTIKSLCPDSEILEAFSVEGGIERDGILFVMEGDRAEEVDAQVSLWLEKIDILKNKN